MTDTTHTPGPWRWELNESTKTINLVGGRPMFDLTILRPTRWGMNSGTLEIRDTSHDGMNIMHKLHERRDWIAPHAGRAHHARWCANVIHPDMRLIAAAPELLAAAKSAERLAAIVAEQATCQIERIRLGWSAAGEDGSHGISVATDWAALRWQALETERVERAAEIRAAIAKATPTP